MSWKCTDTVAYSRSGSASDEWMSSDTLFSRSFLARFPNTNSMASITFDLPLPFGPTTAENRLWNGPISFTPPYDLKFSRTILWGEVGVGERGGAARSAQSASVDTATIGGAEGVGARRAQRRGTGSAVASRGTVGPRRQRRVDSTKTREAVRQLRDGVRRSRGASLTLIWRAEAQGRGLAWWRSGVPVGWRGVRREFLVFEGRMDGRVEVTQKNG